jgi:Flp pilus assembly protein TadG
MDRSLERRPARPRTSQAGTAAVEFALTAIVFFLFVFGILEVARVMYVYNTLQEVTRRAAAAAVNVYPTNTAAIAQLKQDAVFRSSSGELVLGPPVTDSHVRIEYLAYDLSVIPTSSLPTCAADNQQICMANPHSASCIHFVQVRVCDPDKPNACVATQSKGMFPLVSFPITLPTAPTISPIETLGYTQGVAPCSPG